MTNINEKIYSKLAEDPVFNAISQMSEEAQEIFKAYLEDEKTFRDVFEVVLGELLSMDDRVKANQLAIPIFGITLENTISKLLYFEDVLNVESFPGNLTIEEDIK